MVIEPRWRPGQDVVTDLNWWNWPANVMELARHLHRGGEFADIDEVLYFFEKPWKWTKEWKDLAPTIPARHAE